jgi:3-(3-hydroxy-phenyl)propionate hydroxylase
VRAAGQDAWLLDHLGNRFVLLAFVDRIEAIGGALAELQEQSAALAAQAVPVEVIWVTAHAGDSPADSVALHDRDGLIAQRLDARPGSAYLIRPDQHVAARWRAFDAGRLQAALRRATGHEVAHSAASRRASETVTD